LPEDRSARAEEVAEAVRALLRVTALLAGAALLYWGLTFAQVWRASLADEPRPAEAIVVLGAAQYDGQPSPALQARLERAAELHEAGFAPVVVVTGGRRPGDRFTEAKAGQEYLLQRGVPAEALRLEVLGKNSWESLAATARFLRAEDIDEVLLVSDSYHSYRITDIAHEVGLVPHVAPSRGGSTTVRDLARETSAVAIGRVTGYRRLTNLDRALPQSLPDPLR
jgi:uncharacterized SAM-binding protein YcdF (DUF218 family)